MEKRVLLWGMALFAGGVFAGAPVAVNVDPSNVKGRIPRTLYGTGMEDVNHEIYGGLDAQRLYDESFEETLPFQKLPHTTKNESHRVCGRQWTPLTTAGGVSRQEEQVAHWGDYAWRLEPNGATAGAANAGLNGWGVPCEKGKRLVGRFYAWGSVENLDVSVQNSDGHATYATTRVAGAGTNAWRRIDFVLEPNATDAQGRFVIQASGQGCLIVDDVYLATEPTNVFGRLGCREDIVEGFRKEGLTFLRWGGSMVNTPGYSFVNYTGERRPYRGFWFNTSSMGFHVREFVRMAAEMKLPCAFSIYTYESSEEAAKFAAWTRSFDNELLVGIGNEELTGWCDALGARRDHTSCTFYCESVRRLVRVMKAVNPKLKFVSEVMFDTKHMDLMEDAFRQTDGFVDYWDIHVGAGSANAGDGVRAQLKAFRDIIARINPQSKMKAAIFEENGSIHNQLRALAHASILEAAREQNGFLLTSCPANALQAEGQNDNGWDQGQIFYTTDKVWLQPCGWVQQMASAFHRDNWIAGGTTNADVTVSATANDGGTSIVLHLINRTNAPQPVAVAIKGREGAQPACVMTLAAEKLEDHNTSQEPEKVAPRDITAAFRQNPVLPAYSYTVLEFRAENK